MRDAAKLVAHALATVLVAPMIVSFYVRSRILGPDRALQGSTQALALVPGLVGQYLRRAFLARTLRCDRTATIEFGAIFSHPGARIGEHVYIGPHCAIGLVELERDVLLGPGVQILSGAHTHASDDPSRPIRDQPLQRTLVRVGRGAWIGAGAIIMDDVGAGSIVGAGAVVTTPIPAQVVAAGVPARVVRNRIEDATRPAVP